MFMPNKKLKDWQEGMGPIANSVQFSEGAFLSSDYHPIDGQLMRLNQVRFSVALKKRSSGSLGYFMPTTTIIYPLAILLVMIDQDIFNSLFLLFPGPFLHCLDE